MSKIVALWGKAAAARVTLRQFHSGRWLGVADEDWRKKNSRGKGGKFTGYLTSLDTNSDKNNSQKKFYKPPPKKNHYYARTPDINDVLKLMTAMPKEEPHLKDLRKQRNEKKQQRKGTITNKAFFQVLGNGRIGGVKTLSLNTDFNRYLFNPSEGTQRLSLEQCQSKALTLMSDVFITKKNWQNLGGFPGICLTARGFGVNEINLHGPPGCMRLFESTKDFVVLQNFEVVEYDIMKKDLEDGSVIVKGVDIPYAGPTVMPGEPKYSEWIPRGQKSDQYRPRDLPVAAGQPLDQTVLAYVITIKSKLPKLQITKCLEYGVQPGPLLGKLKQGMDVTLECGKVVRSADVCDDSEPALQAVVVDCPNEHYIEGVVNNDQMQFNGEDSQVRFVFHFTPSETVHDPRYTKWMESFSDEVEHVLINEGCQDWATKGRFRYNRKLVAMAPDLFPEQLHRGDEKSLEGLPKNAIYAKGGAEYHIRPNLREVDERNVPKHDTSRYTDENEEWEEEERVRKALTEAKHAPPDMTKPEFPAVTFLGTASSMPGKYRNVSSILVETAKDRFILLDCGEGTHNQLQQHFGPERAQHILCNLKAVHTSHSHADHHMGLVNIVLARNRAFAARGHPVEKLFLMTFARMAYFLKYYHLTFESILDHLQHVKLEHLLLTSVGGINASEEQKMQFIDREDLKEIKASLGLSSLVCSRALHCAHAFCISMTTAAGDGFKMIYTGDTRPCDWLEELAAYERPPDLIIHEATLEHYQLADAKLKMHSTFTEAVESCRKMKAGFTLLTHFSQRYSKVPLLDEFKDVENVGVAFDHVTVSPRTLHQLRLMYPTLESVFVESLSTIRSRRETRLERREFFESEMAEEMAIMMDTKGEPKKKKRKKEAAEPINAS